MEAGYKARPWEPGAPESYPSKLTSEGVTIAVQALFSDDLAARVFDKNDMITRGIMPLAVVIFNDNDFPVIIEGDVIELINEDDHLHTLPPDQAVQILFQKGKKNILLPRLPIPTIPSDGSIDRAALDDFQYKFLGTRVAPPKGKAAGFLYLRIPVDDVRGYLHRSLVYIPRIHRQDTGKALIYFEIELEPSITSSPRN
jgi:hypothetical protein